MLDYNWVELTPVDFKVGEDYELDVQSFKGYIIVTVIAVDSESITIRKSTGEEIVIDYNNWNKYTLNMYRLGRKSIKEKKRWWQ